MKKLEIFRSSREKQFESEKKFSLENVSLRDFQKCVTKRVSAGANDNFHRKFKVRRGMHFKFLFQKTALFLLYKFNILKQSCKGHNTYSG